MGKGKGKETAGVPLDEKSLKGLVAHQIAVGRPVSGLAAIGLSREQVERATAMAVAIRDEVEISQAQAALDVAWAKTGYVVPDDLKDRATLHPPRLTVKGAKGVGIGTGNGHSRPCTLFQGDVEVGNFDSYADALRSAGGNPAGKNAAAVAAAAKAKGYRIEDRAEITADDADTDADEGEGQGEGSEEEEQVA